MKRTRLIAALGTALAAILAVAPAALARGGSGSSGFGGGGGGGGGRGFGNGHFFFVPIGGGTWLLVLIVIAILVRVVLPQLTVWWRGRQSSGTAARRRVAQREQRVELAAAEASDDDESFAPDTVRRQAATLFTDVQAAWDADDRIRLRSLVAPELLEEWELRLDDLNRRGWRNRVQVLSGPTVEYVGLRNLAGEDQDRVVVRIEATLSDYVEDSYGRRIDRADTLGSTSHVREFWTLGKRAGRWILISIEQGAEGAHALSDELIADPTADVAAMRDASLLEGAAADAVPEGTDIAELADLDFTGDARAAALDLSLADGRFAPDVLEVAARRAVAAWAEAVDGDDADLLEIAHAEAARDMLHPGDPTGRTRLVVRGPQVRQIRIAGLDAAASPPTMTIEVELNGRRYIEDRETAAVLSGSQSRATSFTEHWTLALDGGPQQPWRISRADSGAPPLARR